MATPKAVARSLRKSATRLSGVQDETVRIAGERAVESGLNIGGTFGRRRLIVEVVQKRSSKKRSEITVWPKPANLWSIDAFGRGEVRPVRRSVLRFYDGGEAVFARRVGPAGPGKRRWQRWRSDMDSIPRQAGEEALREAMG